MEDESWSRLFMAVSSPTFMAGVLIGSIATAAWMAWL